MAARSTGNPEFFYAFFIEKFVTVNGYGLLLPEGREGVRGNRGSPYFLGSRWILLVLFGLKKIII